MNANRPSGPAVTVGTFALRSNCPACIKKPIVTRVEHDLGSRGGLAIGEQDDPGQLLLAAPEGEVERLTPLGRPEGARVGRLVTRGLDPDEEGSHGSLNLSRVSTARDFHRLVLSPVDLVPLLVLVAPDQAELGSGRPVSASVTRPVMTSSG